MKGILSEEKQARAREMLREIGDKKPYMSTLDKVELRKVWVLKRNFTDGEFDHIQHVHGRIRKGKQDV